MEIRQNDLERGIDVIVDIRREESYDQLKSRCPRRCRGTPRADASQQTLGDAR